ncbi:MAG: NUDIX domain-containing protein [Candidatus Doudnabacteria bacterium]|nr:NUDIX domain-containing protein [Candidatus Doudnabacteria bacterium]
MSDKKAIHEVADLKVAAEVCVVCDGKVLLQKRSPSAKNFPGFWTLPGGHVDFGEDALTAAIREVEEETSIRLTPSETRLRVQAINFHKDRNQTWLVFGFYSQLNEMQSCRSTYEGEVEWIEIAKVNDLEIFPPIKYYLDWLLEGGKGTMFMAGEWENSQLVQLFSRNISAD